MKQNLVEQVHQCKLSQKNMSVQGDVRLGFGNYFSLLDIASNGLHDYKGFKIYWKKYVG